MTDDPNIKFHSQCRTQIKYCSGAIVFSPPISGLFDSFYWNANRNYCRSPRMYNNTGFSFVTYFQLDVIFKVDSPGYLCYNTNRLFGMETKKSKPLGDDGYGSAKTRPGSIASGNTKR